MRAGMAALIATGLTVLLAVTAPAAQAPSTGLAAADSSWAGRSLQILWQRDVGRSVIYSPLILPGRLIATVAEGKVICLDLEDGHKIWSRGYKDVIEAPPVYLPAAAGSGKGRLCLALGVRVQAIQEKDGKPVWTRRVKTPVTAMAADSTRLYLQEKRGRIAAWNSSDGEEVWGIDFGGWDAGGILLADGRVYALARTDSVLAVDRASGRRLWSAAPGGTYAAAPSRIGEDLVVVATDGALTRLDPADGAVRGRGHRAPPQLNPAEGNEGAILTVSGDGVVESQDPSRPSEGWKVNSDQAVEAPLVPAGPLVFVAGTAGTLQALRADRGTSVWSLKARGGFHAAPVVTPDYLILGTDRGDVYVYSHAD